MRSGERGRFLLAAVFAATAATLPSLAGPPSGRGGEGPCTPTVENIEGPYYLPGAPFRERIAPAEARGSPLVLSGRVTAADCVTPLSGAVIDVWQTGAAGEYDFSRDFRWRGRVRTDADGRYRVETIVPGRYQVGRSFRPAHIHLRVSHPAGRTLVTQVYFENDPYLEADPFVRGSLVIPLRKERRDGEGIWGGTFDIVLAGRENP